MTDEKIIRKKYGEKMWHYCRSNFGIILDTPGRLSEILLEKFYPSHALYEDMELNDDLYEFKKLVFDLFHSIKKDKINADKTPEELLKEAGYTLYECKTEEDIQQFKKYYKKNEELCTFHGGRLNSCHVFFAVKDNVEEIRRENFINPEREDEYGTSVISIQFTKDSFNYLSIKNRYNHTVVNPDATFGNDLDNIIPGLTNSFENTYGFIQQITPSHDFNSLVLANDGKYYSYTMERRNVYYCRDNIIIDDFNVVDKYAKEKDRYLLFDGYILDLKEKKFLYTIINYMNQLLNSNKIF